MTSKTAMNPATVVVLLTLMLGIQAITTDLYLPALPMLWDPLESTCRHASLSIL